MRQEPSNSVPPEVGMTFEGLVPDDFEEFRSVKFWDGFFQKRKHKAFEWYGEWRQLQPLVWGACARPNKQILMLGCGNSDLSAQMWASRNTISELW